MVLVFSLLMVHSGISQSNDEAPGLSICQSVVVGSTNGFTPDQVPVNGLCFWE